MHKFPAPASHFKHMLCRTGHQLSNTILYSLTAARNLCKMARTVAIALVALLAFSMAAEISAAFCRTSAYKGVLPATLRDNKVAMFKACGADVTIVGDVKEVNGCTIIVQRVASEAAWKKYSECEKTPANGARYNPLKAGSSACTAQQKSGAC